MVLLVVVMVGVFDFYGGVGDEDGEDDVMGKRMMVERWLWDCEIEEDEDVIVMKLGEEEGMVES